eukprot:TRINITY_DN2895_c1_g1_i2.p1 TRINITY_DN2895_c1_g1~~TRINITY_DN2895_c1_g1_i2.p1  ORF type:complete len:1623 (+),score=417.01 TRINITY_DN2895_c1_g1_i2:500-4870(+)
MKDFELIEERISVHQLLSTSSKKKLRKEAMMSREVNFCSSDDEEVDTTVTNQTFINFKNANTLKNLEDMLKITESFQTTAETYAKMIITEKNVPVKKKKIPPADLQHGVAGGKKFKVHDMFFKFPEDKQTKLNHWLYGRTQQDDRIAGKATNHELKGLVHLMNADVKKEFNFPMIVLIDYQGYRQTVLVKLPIKENKTLIYGSSDGGTNVRCEEEVHNYLKEISPKLNLREHQVKKHYNLVLCTDIEIHSLEDQLYVLDYARILPPVAPKDIGNTIFYRLMRPEMLQRVAYPVSCDAFSTFQTSEVEWNDAIGATNLLFERIEELFKTFEASSKFLSLEDIRYIKKSKPQFSSIQPKDLFTRKLHKEGINFRYMGKIVLLLKMYKELTPEEEHDNNERIDFMFSLMTIRILKNLWRKQIQVDDKNNVHDVCLSVTIKLINEFFTKREVLVNDVESVFNNMFVDGILERDEKQQLIEEFKQFFETMKDPHHIILRFCQICGIEPNKAIVSALTRKFDVNLSNADVQSFVTILKPPPMVTYLNAIYFVSSAKNSTFNFSIIQFLMRSITFIEYTLGYSFHTTLLEKLHDFVSFEILKYNRKYIVHWSKIMHRMKEHKKEFECFVGLPIKIAEKWKFFQNPLRNLLEQPPPKPFPLFSHRIEDFFKLFENFACSFLKDCFEYMYEKEQYSTVGQTYDKERRKFAWNDLLKKIQIPEFIHKLESEKEGHLNIEDIQNWDIDFRKKEILLFLNHNYLTEADDKSMHYLDKFTKKSIFGENPISKSLIFEIHSSSNSKLLQRDIIHKIFLLNFEKKIKDDLFEKNIVYSHKTKFTLYLLLFPIEFNTSQYSQKFHIKNTEKIRNSTHFEETAQQAFLGTPFFNLAKQNLLSEELLSIAQLLQTNSTLTSIDLSSNTLGKETLKLIQGLIPNVTITQISLSDNLIGNEEMQHISDYLKSNSTVTSLSLKNNDIGNEGIHFISEILKSNSTITSINLQNNKVGNEGAQFISECLSSNSTITSVNFEGNHMELGIMNFLNCLLNKQSTLDLSRNKIGCTAIQFITKYLSSNSTITKINLAENQIGNEGIPFISLCLRSNSTLTSLDLRKNGIGNSGLHSLLDFLRSNTTINSLDLTGNEIEEGIATFIHFLIRKDSTVDLSKIHNKSIGIEGVRFISDSLTSNSSITSLNLSKVSIGNELHLILESLKHNKAITTIDLTGMGQKISDKDAILISECLRFNSTIKSILLPNNNIGPSGIKCITESLKSNSTVTEIDLEWNRISDPKSSSPDGAKWISDCLKFNSKISTILLGSNSIDLKGIEHILESLKSNPTVTTISLGSSSISNPGAKIIANFLKSNTTIAFLRLRSSKIGNEGAGYISECLKVNSTLKSLDLRVNVIENNGAKFISECFALNSTLTEINLEKNRITHEGAEYLLDGLRRNSTVSVYLKDNSDIKISATARLHL